MTVMIQLEDLSKHFGELVAVDGISLNVAKGEVLGFLGPNGAGKSTTMKMVAGFFEPTGGFAKVCGFDVSDDPVAVKERIGYLPEGAPERRMFTRNQVDLQSVRVRQTELGEGADAELGWDGSDAWITPSPEAFPAPAVFWATTPYYFVGMPFVLADPGTNHTLEGPVTLTDPAGQTIETQAIRVTFDSGIGQAPDDFYVVHADPETHQMVALRYIVTDPSVRRPDAPPPKQTILFYRDPVTTGGLTMTTHYDGFHWRDDAPADRKSTADITNISFGPPLEDALFQRSRQ